jgi:NAD(P)-dependent dehydrogenase (short-subunit alcohol dehydrogenase family)
MPDLSGRTALVTGGGRGIGRAIAVALARAGCAVGIGARSQEELDETVSAIRAAGGRVEARALDVTDREQVSNSFEALERELGPIDLLVNNAGRSHALGPITESDPDEWWRDVEINLRGPYLCTRQVLPGMLERGGGRIVNVGSNLGLHPMPYAIAYAASKAALMRLTDSLALELRNTGIVLLSVSPGMVHTRLMERVEEMRRANDPNVAPLPAHAFQPAEKIAALVCRVAAGELDALNGRYVHVQDDVDALLARADEIEKNDLQALRLRK